MTANLTTHEQHLVEQATADLRKDLEHWKANHANMVQRSRVLMDRTDLPLERVKAFEQIGEMQATINDLRAATTSAAWALHQAERKLNHLAPHYKGRSAREIYDAAECAKKAAETLDAAIR